MEPLKAPRWCPVWKNTSESPLRGESVREGLSFWAERPLKPSAQTQSWSQTWSVVRLVLDPEDCGAFRGMKVLVFPSVALLLWLGLSSARTYPDSHRPGLTYDRTGLSLKRNYGRAPVRADPSFSSEPWPHTHSTHTPFSLLLCYFWLLIVFIITCSDDY